MTAAPNWFSKGYEKVEEVSKRIEERMNQEWLPRFSLADGESAQVTFLTDTPLNYYEHFLSQNKKTFTCSQMPDCPLCAIGNKPSFKGAYLIIDHREETWQDKKTGETKTRKDTLKIMQMGIRALKVIERKNAKKSLLKYDYIITRTGKGNDTQYDFEVADDRIPFVMPERVPAIEEVLKPRSREEIMQALAMAGAGQPSRPFQVSKADENSGVIDFRK